MTMAQSARLSQGQRVIRDLLDNEERREILENKALLDQREIRVIMATKEKLVQREEVEKEVPLGQEVKKEGRETWVIQVLRERRDQRVILEQEKKELKVKITTIPLWWT